MITIVWELKWRPFKVAYSFIYIWWMLWMLGIYKTYKVFFFSFVLEAIKHCTEWVKIYIQYIILSLKSKLWLFLKKKRIFIKLTFFSGMRNRYLKSGLSPLLRKIREYFCSGCVIQIMILCKPTTKIQHVVILFSLENLF